MTVPSGSSPSERSLVDLQASEGMGMAAIRIEERVGSAFGLGAAPSLRFESCQSIPGGGVLFLLPFLLECGLLSYRNHYEQRSGYYTFDPLIITLAFLYLLRIKNPEQTKLHNPGELGKLVGYDRIPEVKKLRGMIKELTDKGKCSDWGKSLSKEWIEDEAPELYYIDGHVQVYHGYLANLGKKHVSRQRLCLPGMMEFWVNGQSGLPFFFITARVNEKMIAMLEDEIIPALLELHPVDDELQQKMDSDPDYPRFTLVFDREAYSPEFFKRLWDKHKIAALTYRKNVKDTWDEALFEDETVETRMGEVTMKLHEQALVTDQCPMREIRKLSQDGHQTSIVTTHRIWSIALIACHMFGRWVQENFFRYMRQEYSFDRILQYAIDNIDSDITVVNREYSNITCKIKKKRETLARRKAKLYDREQHNQAGENEEIQEKETGKWLKKQLELSEQIKQIEVEIEKLTTQRKQIPYKIPLSKMPEDSRYNRLNQESKHFQNIIKMICYRAETAFANSLAPHYKRSFDEIRTLVKAIINQTVDLFPDCQNNFLNITLYPLANQRSNRAVKNIIDTINLTNTIYQGTNLVMRFKIATI
ncbi:hypothetical protein AGMMS50239_15390 [Bacteroidia bacterium]|nr:hypothetical protein AGMMS50239_15390 [Bacteroidia bacterium]